MSAKKAKRKNEDFYPIYNVVNPILSSFMQRIQILSPILGTFGFNGIFARVSAG